MRHLRQTLIFLLPIINFNLQSQTTEKVKLQIDSLSRKKDELEKALQLLTQSIDSKQKLLSELQANEPEKSLTIKLSKDVNVLDRKSIAYGEKVFEIKGYQEFTLLNFENEFYFVDFKGMKGYIYYVFINGAAGIDDFKAYWIKKNKERRKIEEQSELTDQRTKRLKHLDEEFGHDNALKIINKKIWIGMTDRMANESIGPPDKKNASTFSSGTNEQWIYKDRYLYFENGVLVSWQDQK